MPDLIPALRQAGLSEADARKACRVVAEWLGNNPQAIVNVLADQLHMTPGPAVRAVGAATAAVCHLLCETGDVP